MVPGTPKRMSVQKNIYHFIPLAALILLFQGSSVGTKDSLRPAAQMHEMRASHSATLLLDGKVLIAGGFKKVHTYAQEYFSNSELYDPATNTFTSGGALTTARCGHTATLLHDGKVFIAGGGNDQPLAGCEIYDPGKNLFTATGSMSIPRQGHTATQLQNGNVLVVGGGSAKSTAEIFNVTTGRFEPTGNLHQNRNGHSATLLPDGRVLIVGGATGEERGRTVLSSAEIFDPATGKFTKTASMSTNRYKHAAILLPDSTVLIVGGSNEHDWTGQYNSAELFHARRNAFSRVGDMAGKRFKLPNGVTMLQDGSVLVAGGGRTIELYNRASHSFSPVAQFDEPHFYSTVTRLNDGNVLIAGGYDTRPQSTDNVWIYKPGDIAPVPAR